VVVPGHGRVFDDVPGALARAYSRLDYLSSDPRRNAENAVKVLVKFLLLERQRIALAEMPGLLASIPVVAGALRLIGRVDGKPAHASNELPHVEHAEHDEYRALATWATTALVRANAARIDGPWLVDQ